MAAAGVWNLKAMGLCSCTLHEESRCGPKVLGTLSSSSKAKYSFQNDSLRGSTWMTDRRNTTKHPGNFCACVRIIYIYIHR